MKRMLLIAGILFATACVFPNQCYPDLLPPGKRNSRLPSASGVPFKVTTNPKTTENRLVIPRKFLNRPVAVDAAQKNSISGAGLRSLVGGLALSLSAVSLTFLLIRRKKAGTRLTAVLLVTGVGGFFCADYVVANLAPPDFDRPPSVLNQLTRGQQNVTIEITKQGKAVELVLGTGRQRPRQRQPSGSPRPSTGSSLSPKSDVNPE